MKASERKAPILDGDRRKPINNSFSLKECLENTCCEAFDILPSVFDTHLNFVSLAKEATQAKDGFDLKPDIHHIYDSLILKGYSATLSQDVQELIRRRPEVQYVEQDQAGYGGDFQRNAPWVRSV